MTEELVDGRVVRRERNRDSVVDAIMVLIRSGESQPALADVAQLAGVSERSIFRHFESRDALLAAVVERQVEMVTGLLREIAPTGPVADRISAFVNERSRLYEEITPMRRAALQVVGDSELVSGRLADIRQWLRDELEAVFERELSRRSSTETPCSRSSPLSARR